eukprot:gene2635-2936_t
MASLPFGTASASGASQQRSNGLTSREQAYIVRMGERGYKRFEAIKKEERQRVWDNMRLVAAARYKDGLWEGTALPPNPGEAFKMPDIAQRHKIWDYWGYADVTMR